MEIGISLSNTSVLATPETLLGMADKAEELGFASIWVGDHIALPYTLRQPYPYSRGAPSRAWIAESPIYDPVVLMSVIAGRTQRLKVAVGVLVLPYRHGVLTAKMAATLDVLSGGRLLLGVGIGWMSEEFDVMGMRFSERGAVTDEQIRLFRELWYKEKPEFHGKYYNMAGMTFLPRPRGKIPILVGGNTLPALRRHGSGRRARAPTSASTHTIPTGAPPRRASSAAHGRAHANQSPCRERSIAEVAPTSSSQADQSSTVKRRRFH